MSSLAEEAKPRARRALDFWRPLNAWWRDYVAAHQKRPGTTEVDSWFDAHAESVWGDSKPTKRETRLHANCLRPVDEVKAYFRQYRKRKADGSRGQEETPEEDWHAPKQPRPHAPSPQLPWSQQKQQGPAMHQQPSRHDPSQGTWGAAAIAAAAAAADSQQLMPHPTIAMDAMNHSHTHQHNHHHHHQQQQQGWKRQQQQQQGLAHERQGHSGTSYSTRSGLGTSCNSGGAGRHVHESAPYHQGTGSPRERRLSGESICTAEIRSQPPRFSAHSPPHAQQQQPCLRTQAPSPPASHVGYALPHASHGAHPDHRVGGSWAYDRRPSLCASSSTDLTGVAVDASGCGYEGQPGVGAPPRRRSAGMEGRAAVPAAAHERPPRPGTRLSEYAPSEHRVFRVQHGGAGTQQAQHTQQAVLAALQQEGYEAVHPLAAAGAMHAAASGDAPVMSPVEAAQVLASGALGHSVHFANGCFDSNGLEAGLRRAHGWPDTAGHGAHAHKGGSMGCAMHVSTVEEVEERDEDQGRICAWPPLSGSAGGSGAFSSAPLTIPRTGCRSSRGIDGSGVRDDRGGKDRGERGEHAGHGSQLGARHARRGGRSPTNSPATSSPALSDSAAPTIDLTSAAGRHRSVKPPTPPSAANAYLRGAVAQAGQPGPLTRGHNHALLHLPGPKALAPPAAYALDAVHHEVEEDFEGSAAAAAAAATASLQALGERDPETALRLLYQHQAEAAMGVPFGSFSAHAPPSGHLLGAAAAQHARHAQHAQRVLTVQHAQRAIGAQHAQQQQQAATLHSLGLGGHLSSSQLLGSSPFMCQLLTPHGLSAPVLLSYPMQGGKTAAQRTPAMGMSLPPGLQQQALAMMMQTL